MGVGKTEAVLIGVEQLSAKTQASGMFLVCQPKQHLMECLGVLVNG